MRPLKHDDTCEVPVELEGPYGLAEEFTLLVSYTYHPGCRGATDGPGGPPIEPDTAACAEVTKVLLYGPGKVMNLIRQLDVNDYDEAELADKCLEHAEED
jgi:hypothetical protein